MKRILVVDDSRTDYASIEQILASAGYDVMNASSSDEVAEKVRLFPPDVIIMDLVIPGTGGFQLTKRLSQSEETKHIPIIIVSSKSAEVDRMWGLRNGAKEYVVKPVSAQNVLPVVEGVLREEIHD